MDYKRSDRVGDLIKEEIASMALRGGIKDPRVGYITITKVKMSPDLKEARVYFSQMGEKEDIEKSIKGLESASGFIRRHLAKSLKLKHIPNLKFFFDDTIEYSDHINRVIKEMKEGGSR